MPHACQIGWKTTGSNGHPRTSRTASHLGSGRLTRCVKRPSKQSLATALCQSVLAAGSPDLRPHVEDGFAPDSKGDGHMICFAIPLADIDPDYLKGISSRLANADR
jgi:hypothetical protein